MDLNSQQWQRNSTVSERYEPEQAPSTVRAMDLYVCHQVHGSQLTVLFTLHSFLLMFQLCRRHAHISLLRPGREGAHGPWRLWWFLYHPGHRISRQGGAFRESVLLEYQQVVISSSIPLSSEHSCLLHCFLTHPPLTRMCLTHA